MKTRRKNIRKERKKLINGNLLRISNPLTIRFVSVVKGSRNNSFAYEQGNIRRRAEMGNRENFAMKMVRAEGGKLVKNSARKQRAYRGSISAVIA